jgi:hypothetical protein
MKQRDLKLSLLSGYCVADSCYSEVRREFATHPLSQLLCQPKRLPVHPWLHKDCHVLRQTALKRC